MHRAIAFVLAASAPAVAKETRQPFAHDYDVRTSDDFALHWQPELVGLDDTTAAELLQDLDDAFARFHGAAGHRLPVGADDYRLNVYVATSQTDPAIEGYGAYASTEDDGIPYIVVSHEMSTASDPGARFVLAHEYFHAVQFATGAYTAPVHAGDPVGWWFEATANWAATTVWPDDGALYGDLARYIGSAEQPLFLASSTLRDDSPLYAHEYGAFLFPLYLEQFHGGAALLRDAWETAGPADDPLDVVDRLVPGWSIAELFADFAARNAVWDYPEPARTKIAAWLPVIDADPSVPPRTALVVGPGPTDGAVRVDDGRALHAFGYHVVEVVPGDAPMRLTIDVDEGSEDALAATLVLPTATATGFERLAVPLDAAPGEVDVPVGTGRAWLVVSATGPGRDVDATFGYAVTLAAAPARIDDDPASDDDIDGPGPACACRGAPDGRGGLPAVLCVAAALGARRPRRAADRNGAS